MTSNLSDIAEELMYVKCPFPDITGCDFMMIVKGYCTIGEYCIRDCAYTWRPIRDNAYIS